jgi:cobyrinic acid a,c-diamide synthase
VGGKNGSGLVIAAPASGSGKTTLTLGLLRHLAASGRSVASAKAGPDYIDPAFHAAATGKSCVNLDPWAMRPETLARAAGSLQAAAEIIIAEGVMGLFDGAFVKQGEKDGSTAELSRLTGWPVILVIDASAQAASAAAVLKGFAEFNPDVTIAGGSRRAGPGLPAQNRRTGASVPAFGSGAGGGASGPGSVFR